MACSCSKKGMRNTMSPRAGLARGVTGPRTGSVTGGIAAAQSPSQVRALAVAPSEDRSPSGLNGERRKVEKVRRDAIKKALGR